MSKKSLLLFPSMLLILGGCADYSSGYGYPLGLGYGPYDRWRHSDPFEFYYGERRPYLYQRFGEAAYRSWQHERLYHERLADLERRTRRHIAELAAENQRQRTALLAEMERRKASEAEKTALEEQLRQRQQAEMERLQRLQQMEAQRLHEERVHLQRALEAQHRAAESEERESFPPPSAPLPGSRRPVSPPPGGIGDETLPIESIPPVPLPRSVPGDSAAPPPLPKVHNSVSAPTRRLAAPPSSSPGEGAPTGIGPLGAPQKRTKSPGARSWSESPVTDEQEEPSMSDEAR